MVGFTTRVNADKANTTGLGTTRMNDADDTISACHSCYKSFGCIGVAVLAIAMLGATYFLGAGSSSSNDCLEWCSYDSHGIGTCIQFLCGN